MSPDRDESALRATYREYAPALVRYAAGLLADADAAADVVLEVFWAAWSRRAALTPFPPGRAYWYRAVKHRVFNLVARERTRSRAHDAWGAASDGVTDPEQDASERERRRDDDVVHERLALAVRALPPRTREVLLLQREHDLSYREVGEILGISELTVKTHVARALRTLREQLRAGTPSPGEEGALVYSDSVVPRSDGHADRAHSPRRRSRLAPDR
jgi:RNA polymerase sigma-70 factor (ECF subfamily)